MEKAKYIEVDDKDKVEEIKQSLKSIKERFGEEYCPCVVIRNIKEEKRINFICPCLIYRTTGKCKCGLYKE